MIPKEMIPTEPTDCPAPERKGAATGVILDERLLGLLPAAVYVCDHEGKIVYFNGRAAELWGREPRCGDTDERFCGAFRLYYPDGTFMSHASSPMAEALRTGLPQRDRDAVLQRPDGSRIDVLVNIDPLRDPRGELLGAVNVFQDVSHRKRAERDQSLLAAIVESSDHPIISKTLEGVISSWNPAAERLFGYTAAEAVGKPIELIIPPERQDEEQAILARLRCGERIEQFETVRMDKSGRRVHVSLSISPVRSPSGRVVGASKIVRDITDRKRAEQTLRESEERFRNLADNIAQLAWMADPSGWIFWYNKRWFDFTGSCLSEMEGWGWQTVHHPDYVEAVKEKFRRHIEAGEVWEDTFPLRGKDGTYRWFLSRAIPIRDEKGNVLRWFGTNTDITERMEMEEALKEADRRKDEFLAMLGHELRNPLTPIRSGLDLLTTENGTQREIVELMQRQVEHLARLVDDLLDVSRIMRGRVELRKEPVELSRIVRQAVESVQPSVDAHDQQLSLSLPDRAVWLDADRVRLVQICENLLHNASKYTRREGRIELIARCAGDEAVISVRDNGIGIEPELLPKVFDLFTQSSRSLDRAQGGLGIGLTLVRNLVEMHGGTVSAHSDGSERGSTFTVRLPVRAAAHRESSREPAPAGSTSRRILVVDDNQSAVRMLSLLLTRRGAHTIGAAYDGPAALAQVREFRPEIVLLDIGLPGMSGYEVARRIRANPQYDGILLVALTGYGQEQDRRASKEAGFDEHLVKPPAWDQLQRLFVHRKLKVRSAAP